MIDFLLSSDAIMALITLTFLEVVLGIDNIVFISILSDKLPEEERPKARQLGLVSAMVMRILLLFSIKWLISLDEPFIHPFGFPVFESFNNLVLDGVILIG